MYSWCKSHGWWKAHELHGCWAAEDKPYLYFCMEKPSEHIFNEKNKSLDSHSQGYLAWGFPSPKLVKGGKLLVHSMPPQMHAVREEYPEHHMLGANFPGVFHNIPIAKFLPVPWLTQQPAQDGVPQLCLLLHKPPSCYVHGNKWEYVRYVYHKPRNQSWYVHQLSLYRVIRHGCLREWRGVGRIPSRPVPNMYRWCFFHSQDGWLMGWLIAYSQGLYYVIYTSWFIFHFVHWLTLG